MDELLRHHPDLKDPFMKCYMKMMHDVCRDIIPEIPASGPKMPELVQDDPSIGPNTSLFPCMFGDRVDLMKARLEEERNTPAILFTRSVVSV